MSLQKRMHLVGAAILGTGLLSASLIYVFAADDAATTIELGDRRSNEFQIERIGDKAAVYAVRFNEWLGSLWHGPQLALTIGAMSLVIALACFWIADRAKTPLPGDQDEDAEP